MTASASSIKRAPDRETIAPLIDLCKAGKLFEVQDWIAEGRPVNPPPYPGKGQRKMSPLDYAIDRGFHSLMKVLLAGGAVQEGGVYRSPMSQALSKRRFDIVQLLVDNGFDPHQIDMAQVFDTWDPQIMTYFIDRGADLVTDQPFAEALCNRVRTALTLYKKLRAERPELQIQADIALRHHCCEGNVKWVSLMLWAVADPLARGPSSPSNDREDDDDEDGSLNALGYAALYEHYEVFDLKPIRQIQPGPATAGLVRHLVQGGGVEVLKRLLDRGLDPNDSEGGGCSAINACLSRMQWYRGGSNYYDFLDRSKDRKTDNQQCRDLIKSIHLLARHGGKWKPNGKEEVVSARRGLLKLVPDYTAEFVWIMAKYRACDPDDLIEMLRTPTIRKHRGKDRERIDALIERLRGTS